MSLDKEQSAGLLIFVGACRLMLSGNGLPGTQAAGRLRRFLRRVALGFVGLWRKGFLALFFFLFQFERSFVLFLQGFLQG